MKNKKENLKIKIAIGGQNSQEIETNILLPEIGGNYYIPTEYRDPLKCKLIDYNCCMGIENTIRIMAVISLYSREKLNLKDIQPELLFRSKQEASEYYLKNKNDLNFEYLKEENK